LSVAHAGFFVAQRLGVSPIALVGVDLAFTAADAAQTHAAGTFAHWGTSAGADAKRAAERVTVRCTDGEQRESLLSMTAMATAFESAAAASNAPVWNCSPRGVRLAGTTEAPIADLPVAGPKPAIRDALTPLAVSREQLTVALSAAPRRSAAGVGASDGVCRVVRNAPVVGARPG
jgi:hypothetical protein